MWGHADCYQDRNGSLELESPRGGWKEAAGRIARKFARKWRSTVRGLFRFANRFVSSLSARFGDSVQPTEQHELASLKDLLHEVNSAGILWTTESKASKLDSRPERHTSSLLLCRQLIIWHRTFTTPSLRSISAGSRAATGNPYSKAIPPKGTIIARHCL